MRIAVIGTGGVGGYFGARLAAAGEEVVFAARGDHAAAIREHGLEVLSPLGDLLVRPATLLDDLDKPGWFDVALIAVKMYDLDAAAERARTLVNGEAAVVPLQNGVEAAEIVARRVGRRQTCGGVAYIASAIERPGVVRHKGRMARLLFGELGGGTSWRLDSLEAACTAAGVEAQQSAAIQAEIWKKFVMLATFATASCLARGPIGAICADPARASEFATLVAEAAAVGRASGAELSDDVVEATLRFAAGLPEGMKSSMLLDLEAGKRLELDWLTGAIVRLGAERCVATPVAAAAYERLAPLKDGRPGP
jgi:2-dehydropantoate 2-reductase